MSSVIPLRAVTRTAAEAELIARLPRDMARLPGSASVLSHREAALAQFAATGLPNRRVEAWKYTDLRAAMADAAPLAATLTPDERTAALQAPAALASEDAVVFAIVNGEFAGVIGALPEGVTMVPLAAALAKGHDDLAFMGKLEIAQGDVALALNTAFMTDGVMLRVAAGVSVAVPLLLRVITQAATPSATAVRVLVVVEEGASVTLVESLETRGAGHQPNIALELSVGDGARVTHVRASAHHEGTVALATLAANLGAEADLSSVQLVHSGALQRNQAFVRFDGANARLTVNGGTLIKGRQHADATLVVDHAEPGGVSRELFRTAADDASTGVFQGKIMVRQKAQQTDGRMASNAVLLADGAAMYNKPELEIFADDVQCAHGATCGALDDDLLFYLMARGIPRREAEALMIESFVGETLEPIAHDGLREALTAQIESWLKARV